MCSGFANMTSFFDQAGALISATSIQYMYNLIKYHTSDHCISKYIKRVAYNIKYD